MCGCQIRTKPVCWFQAVLASIVFVNLKGMFKQYSDVATLWRSSKIDLVRVFCVKSCQN